MAIVPATEEDYRAANDRDRAVLAYLVDQAPGRKITLKIADVLDAQEKRILNHDYWNANLTETDITLWHGEPAFEFPDYAYTPGTVFKRIPDLDFDAVLNLFKDAYPDDTIPGHEGA